MAARGRLPWAHALWSAGPAVALGLALAVSAAVSWGGRRESGAVSVLQNLCN